MKTLLAVGVALALSACCDKQEPQGVMPEQYAEALGLVVGKLKLQDETHKYSCFYESDFSWSFHTLQDEPCAKTYAWKPASEGASPQ